MPAIEEGYKKYIYNGHTIIYYGEYDGDFVKRSSFEPTNETIDLDYFSAEDIILGRIIVRNCVHKSFLKMYQQGLFEKFHL